MKLCIHCRHFIPRARPDGLPNTWGDDLPPSGLCGHPNLLSPVDGTPELDARTARTDGLRLCGRHGGAWAAKP